MANEDIEVKVSAEAVLHKELARAVQEMFNAYGLRIESVYVAWRTVGDSDEVAAVEINSVFHK